MRPYHPIALLLLTVLLVIAATAVTSIKSTRSNLQRVDAHHLRHELLQQRARCNDYCVGVFKKINSCLSTCADIVVNAKFAGKMVRKLEKRMANAIEQASVMSENAEQQQNEATAHLWELFHNNLKALLTNGAFTPGFQLVEPAIDLTDVRTQIPGWESMPSSVLVKQHALDYDNVAVLSEEMIKVSKAGPFRDSNGIRVIDEYKSFLSGLQGVSSLTIPSPDDTLSVQKTQQYEWTLNNCTIKYSTASAMIVSRFDMDQYRTTFCPEVARAEQDMFAQIGREQSMAGGNPSYAAAVALGMAQGLYSTATAFKKYQSFRAMEQECLKSQAEYRPLNGVAKSMSFQYNYHTYKNTHETVKWKVTTGKWIFKKTVNHEKTTITSMDMTNIGGVEIAFEDFKYISLYPGDWYSSSALREFRYSPRDASSSPISRFFGGADSTLTLLPKGLYIATNPSISFWVESSKKDSFQEQTRTAVSSGFKIFGFGFGGGYNRASSVDEGTTTGGKTKVTISSKSCKPQLFAVDNHYNY